MDDNQELLYKKEGGIAVITMNRPEKRNALSPGLFQGIFTSVEDAASDA